MVGGKRVRRPCEGGGIFNVAMLSVPAFGGRRWNLTKLSRMDLRFGFRLTGNDLLVRLQGVIPCVVPIVKAPICPSGNTV